MKKLKTTLTMPELATGTAVNHGLRMEDIPESEIAKRALEVALAGGHPIVFIYQQGAPANELLTAAKTMATAEGIPFTCLASLPCPCGYYGTITSPCVCSLRWIVKHRMKLARRMVGFEMAVEVVSPSGINHRRGEAEEDILVRVRKARSWQLTDATLTADGQNLLNRYAEEVCAGRVSVIQKIATTIASLDCSQRIQPQHLMEAMQYQWLWQNMKEFLPKVEIPEPCQLGA